MASSVIGALRVTLGVSTAAFETGLKKARGGLADFGKAVKVAAVAAGAAFVAAGVAVGAAIKGMIDQADDMSKLAQSVGVPIAELTALKYAADLSGVGIEGLGKGLKKLSQNMFDAAAGVGTAKDAFAALGISVLDSDGKLKTSTQVMTELADKFSKMEDGAGKTALAMLIFGRAGADLIPMLNGGSAALTEMIDEARELGIVIDEETGRKAEAFNDNLTRLQTVLGGIVTQLAARMLPALESFSEVMVVAAKNGMAMASIGKGLDVTFRGLATATLAVVGTVAALGSTMVTVGKAFMWMQRGNYPRAWTELKEGFAGVAETVKATIGQIPTLWRNAAAETVAIAPEASDGIAAPMIAAAGKVSAAKDEIAEAAREAARQQEEAARIIEGLAGRREKAAGDYTGKLAILRRELEAGRLSAEAFDAAVERLNLEFENANGGFEARDIDVNPTLTSPGEIAGINESINAAADEARTAFGQAFSDGVLAATRGDLKSVLSDWVFRWAQKGLDRAGEALFDLFQGAGGWKGVGAAVSSVFSSFKLPGFAGGAQFMVDGMAGIDRNIAAFRVSRNERVTVETPEQQRAGGGRGGVTIIQQFPQGDPDSFRRSGRQVAQATKRALT